MMICPKCGHDMNNSMYCYNCNTYPFKDKEPFQWKKWFKAYGMTIGCFLVFIVVFVGIVISIEKHSNSEMLDSQYEEASKSAHLVSSIEDIQGYWYNDEAFGLLGFQDDKYIAYKFGTGDCITGNVYIDSHAFILSDEDGYTKLESIKIENDVLILEYTNGNTTKWKKINKSDVKQMLLDDLWSMQ